MNMNTRININFIFLTVAEPLPIKYGTQTDSDLSEQKIYVVVEFFFGGLKIFKLLFGARQVNWKNIS